MSAHSHSEVSTPDQPVILSEERKLELSHAQVSISTLRTSCLQRSVQFLSTLGERGEAGSHIKTVSVLITTAKFDAFFVLIQSVFLVNLANGW